MEEDDREFDLRRTMLRLLAVIFVLLFFSCSVSASSCPYDIDFSEKIIPAGCYSNSTVLATGCCWYVFGAYFYAAIRYANQSNIAFLPEELARTCTSEFSDRLVRKGLVAPSLVLSGDRCNIAGDPVKFAAGNRPCQFSKISDVYSTVDLRNATKQCSGTSRNLTTDQAACVACQDAVTAATFSLFDATGSKEIVPCGLAATMGIWASSTPNVDRFVSYALCMVQILENVGNLGTGNIIPSSPRKPAPPQNLSSSGNNSRKVKITVGLVSVGVILLAGASFLTILLIRRKRQQINGATTDFEQTATITRPLPTDGLYIFTKTELHHATSGFHSRNLLGEGAAAKVYLGTLPSGQRIAVKRFRKKSKLNEFYREVEIVAKLRHRRLTTLVGYCLEKKNQALVYEYMPGGNLSAALIHGELSWRRRLVIAADVAEALAYLHDLPDGYIIHRDVKPNNVLLGDDGRAKLSDFGVAKIVSPEMTQARTTIKGTPGYVDPEYAADGMVSQAADVYSFGVMLFQLVSGTKAVVSTPSGGRETIMHLMREGGGVAAFLDCRLGEVAGEDSVEELYRLAERCVLLERIQRPKMTEVLLELRRLLAEESPESRRNPTGAGEDGSSPTTSSSF